MHVTTITVMLAGYLLGSIPFAYLLARRHRGIDLRVAGSGNVGAANLLRTTTKKMGASAMVLDMSKGVATVLVAQRIDPGATGPAVAGIAAVLGHIYPVWLGLIASYILGFKLDLFPIQGYCAFTGAAPGETCGGPIDWFYHLIVPWTVFAVINLG